MAELINTFGLPTGLLVIFLAAAAVGLRWAAHAIVQPIVSAHLELVAHLRAYLEEDSKAKIRMEAAIEAAHVRMEVTVDAAHAEAREAYRTILARLGGEP